MSSGNCCSTLSQINKSFVADVITVDTPSPEGRYKSLGEDDVERVVLTL